MRARSNKEVVEFFIEAVFERHDLSILDEVMRDDYIQHNPDTPPGKKGFREFFEVIFKAMPDFHYTHQHTVAEGNLVMVHSITTGTHTSGPWLGQQATGNKLNFPVVDIFRLQDGLIAEHWDVADTFNLFRQLGIINRLLEEAKRAGI